MRTNSPAIGWGVYLGGVSYVRRACPCPFLTLNISESTVDRGCLLLGAYRKVAGQNRLVTSLMTLRNPMTSRQCCQRLGFSAHAPSNQSTGTLCSCVEPATQYIISLRAFNNRGKGQVIYDLIYTRESAGTLLAYYCLNFVYTQALYVPFVKSTC